MNDLTGDRLAAEMRLQADHDVDTGSLLAGALDRGRRRQRRQRLGMAVGAGGMAAVTAVMLTASSLGWWPSGDSAGAGGAHPVPGIAAPGPGARARPDLVGTDPTTVHFGLDTMRWPIEYGAIWRVSEDGVESLQVGLTSGAFASIEVARGKVPQPGPSEVPSPPDPGSASPPVTGLPSAPTGSGTAPSSPTASAYAPPPTASAYAPPPTASAYAPPLPTASAYAPPASGLPTSPVPTASAAPPRSTTRSVRVNGRVGTLITTVTDWVRADDPTISAPGEEHVLRWNPVDGVEAVLRIDGHRAAEAVALAESVRFDQARRCTAPVLVGARPAGSDLVSCQMGLAFNGTGQTTLGFGPRGRPLIHVFVASDLDAMPSAGPDGPTNLPSGSPGPTGPPSSPWPSETPGSSAGSGSGSAPTGGGASPDPSARAGAVPGAGGPSGEPSTGPKRGTVLEIPNLLVQVLAWEPYGEAERALVAGGIRAAGEPTDPQTWPARPVR